MSRAPYLPNSGEFSSLPAWDRCYWLSRSYIEASSHLCTSMLNSEYSNQYSSSRVVLHLARQGLELFLKASILAATGLTELPGHNLVHLLKSYRRYYPGDEFYLIVPARFALREDDDLFQRELDVFHSTLDQRYRYPVDRKGKDFAVREIFDPREFLREIDELSSNLVLIEFSEIRPRVKDVIG